MAQPVNCAPTITSALNNPAAAHIQRRNCPVIEVGMCCKDASIQNINVDAPTCEHCLGHANSI
eukprot:CAMPEP_0115569934 /NCGR_PEP_ID=MMETSP0271-20121206/105443_1 /TAXON_ID=71861 /ORGANISM="Scrippsiella trochoidea, Strain CCMP3099" /LENGTH=62 /DNA_ID=CAMNT_0003004463 /DNA_START=487 /DNA_END=675 /DNA_ORIENTATION=-